MQIKNVNNCHQLLSTMLPIDVNTMNTPSISFAVEMQICLIPAKYAQKSLTETYIFKCNTVITGTWEPLQGPWWGLRVTALGLGDKPHLLA